MINITAHQATESQKLCQEFLQMHQMAMAKSRIKNIDQISTNQPGWINNPAVYLVLARDSDSQQLLGGLRIHLANEITPLPMAEALGTYPEILQMIQARRRQGAVGELCALWNTRRRALITEKLILSGLALSRQLSIPCILAFVGNHMTNLALRLGFEVDQSLGDKGAFPYPHENYVSRIGSVNPYLLHQAADTVRREVEELSRHEAFSKTYEMRARSITYHFALSTLSRSRSSKS